LSGGGRVGRSDAQQALNAATGLVMPSSVPAIFEVYPEMKW